MFYIWNCRQRFFQFYCSAFQKEEADCHLRNIQSCFFILSQPITLPNISLISTSRHTSREHHKMSRAGPASGSVGGRLSTLADPRVSPSCSFPPILLYQHARRHPIKLSFGFWSTADHNPKISCGASAHFWGPLHPLFISGLHGLSVRLGAPTYSSRTPLGSRLRLSTSFPRYFFRSVEPYLHDTPTLM